MENRTFLKADISFTIPNTLIIENKSLKNHIMMSSNKYDCPHLYNIYSEHSNVSHPEIWTSVDFT